MVTIATDALCAVILRDCPVQPAFWFLEGNMSSDKKASALAFMVGRGRRVTAAVTLDREIVEQRLRTSVRAMVDFWRASVRGGVMSGTIGLQGHFANGLAAVYIATGQDAACVSESSVGVSWAEERDDGLFISATLPNLMLGTVGGGTGLPSQSAGLRILGLQGAGKAEALAEVVAALCLAGEISIAAAFSAGHFGDAHKRLARDRR
jgi:hydroxymethylglutaryl-CoA reductase (NADPH)